MNLYKTGDKSECRFYALYIFARPAILFHTECGGCITHYTINSTSWGNAMDAMYTMFFPIVSIFILIFTIYIIIAAFTNIFPFESGSDLDNEMDDVKRFKPVTSIYFTTDYKGHRKRNEI